ncbi:MAG: pyridoxal phosphate-dependent aminotransferase [Firmicutes bacterium]|nr:pyridoxal phosphate-dependent aminotransferase [Bacillota bacterium]
MYDFNHVVNRQNTKSEKWDTLDNLNSIPFTVADTDFAVAPPILEAIINRITHPILGYTVLEKSFYTAIIDFCDRRHNLKLNKNMLFVTPGVMVGVGVAIDAWTKEGDGIIIQTPVYTPFFRVIENNKRKLIRNPLKLVNGKFMIDFEDLEEGMKKAKAFLLCNPHNPTGRVYTLEELVKIVELAEKYSVLLISDEIHSDIIYPGNKHLTISSISEYAKLNSITMIAPSKTFNIPGLSTSVAIIPDEKLRALFFNKLRALGLHEGNAFGVIALEAAYTKCDTWLEELKVYLETSRNYVIEYIKTNIPKINISTPEGTFLMWLDFSAYGDHKKIQESLIKNNVILTDGLIYGEEGLGFLRLNIGCPRSTLTEGLSRISLAVKELKND